MAHRARAPRETRDKRRPEGLAGPALIVLGIAAMAALAGGAGGCDVGNQQGYEPIQPIAFSHKVHAGDFKMQCLYCHYAAERGRHAGVPPASVCMNCHSQVKTDSPEVQKVATAIENNTLITWTKVHRLPDHVYFDHSRHVVQGGLRCQVCHGPIETMERVRQDQDLGMGACVDCHRNSHTPGPDGAPPSTDCSACHY